MEPKVILASESPRRLQLFAGLDLPFERRPANIDETIGAISDPIFFAQKMAALKAKAIERETKNHTIIGADTIVVSHGQILGKPESKDRAMEMLRLLNGKKHQVITAVAVISPNQNGPQAGHKTTEVEFHDVSEKQMEEYVKGGEPLDKAGAYAIQGEGRFLIKSVKGCFNNVVGLPLCLLIDLLNQAGFSKTRSWEDIASRCC